MVPFNILVAVCLVYVGLLFLVAFLVERRAHARALPWLRSPLIYTLSLSIFCTAWTFYGAVGYAVRSGWEFMTIYLGPTLVFVGWWWVLRKLVRIGKTQRVTSIADLISSRYGKSNMLGVIVTVISVVAATPYIALQLQSVTLSFAVFASSAADGGPVPDKAATALWVAVGLALFTVLFGTRNLDSNERHLGVVTAIAVEAVVKLVALVAVGVFVVWGLAGGPADMMAKINASALSSWDLQPGRWAGLIFLSAAAVLCLPRMFQVMVVENVDERHLATASWAFPLYLFLMCLFVLPIAVAGLDLLPPGTNPDLFVLTLPLAQGQDGLAMLAFLGGFSSATSMVIVASIALATMVSNHIVMPLWLSLRPAQAVSGDVRRIVLLSRRLAIGGIVALGYAYFHLSGGSAALAAIGLISFVGAAQILPAMLGGIFWRGATRVGAVCEGMDPLIHAMFWSLVLNATAFFIGSILTFPGPVERVQGAAFVNVFDGEVPAGGWVRGAATAEDLLILSQRILGGDGALAFFEAEARMQGKAGPLPDPTPGFVGALERRLSGSVGAATAHAMIAQTVGGAAVSVEDLMAVANETAQIMEYSAKLEAQSEELTRTARQLQQVNEKLTRLSVQKDSFLSQISHELRTPMTSIRAFSEILMEGDMPPEMARRHATIIHDEAIRLTRLLDDLLNLSVLENAGVQLTLGLVSLQDMIDRALVAAAQTRPERSFTVHRDPASEALYVTTDADRLTQVFINLISNARKYCAAPEPELRIAVRQRGGRVMVDVIDNGRGIPEDSQALIFEKFARLTDETRAGGAGLGLAICREVMTALGGSIAYLPGQGGTAFRVTFPLRLQEVA